MTCFGRLLSGYGGTQHTQAPGVHNADLHRLRLPAAVPAGRLACRFALLVDPRGSVLVPAGTAMEAAQRFGVDAFYTYINGSLAGANQQHFCFPRSTTPRNSRCA